MTYVETLACFYTSLETKHRCQPSTDTASSCAMSLPRAVEAGGHVRGKTEAIRVGLPHMKKHIKTLRGLRGINAARSEANGYWTYHLFIIHTFHNVILPQDGTPVSFCAI